MSSEYIIEMLHITKVFPGIIANDDITLQLRRGEIHALLGENGAGKPRLQVFSTCANLIRTLPVMTYDKHRVEDVGDGLEDHACESLRYGLMSRPAPNAVHVPKEKPPVIFDPLDTMKSKRRSAW